MTAISPVQGGDLNERNSYLDRAFDTFYPASGPTVRGWHSYPDPLPPHPTAGDLPGLYSKHGLGMALVIAAAVSANMSLFARQFGAPPAVSVADPLLFALTNPL
jgi:hypothetical protein